MIRRAWAGWLRLRHVVGSRGRRRQGPSLQEALGLQLLVLPSVFDPILFRTGLHLAELVSGRVAAGDRVLELGAGAGLSALVAARAGARVVATDLNPAATRCCRANSILNDLEERVDVRNGDLWHPVEGERFDLIVFNPPFHVGTPADDRDLAWRSPDLAARFAEGLERHLAEGGEALVILSTDGEPDAFTTALDRHGLEVEVADQRDLINEVLTVHRVRPAGARAR